MKTSEVLGEVILSGEARPALPLALGHGTVDIGNVMARLVVPVDICFTTEELFRLALVVPTISMRTVRSFICGRA